jgi:acetyltransferase-like isoleucine patch superfamily enzyme
MSYLFELIRGFFKRFLYTTFFLNTSIGKNFKLGRHCSISLWGKSKLDLGKNTYIRNFCQLQIEDGHLSIGDNFFANNFSTINCLHKIVIGSDCLLGEGVKIYDHNHNYKNLNALISSQGYSFGEIHIGDNCWIGSNVVILKGVNIGNNVIIGANCVIHKNIESNTVVTYNTLGVLMETKLFDMAQKEK